MLDRHEANENLNAKVRDTRDAAGAAGRPVADREVPLPGMAAADTTADAVHLWLDGEASEAEARQASDTAVAFWARVAYPVATLALVFAALPFAFGQRRSGGFGMRLMVGIVFALLARLVQ
ncbi:LptF/LptG family permease, partial [Gemmatimonas sp.]|uniref:LptF/LptG family permease n=1 Tax=Gemmatimonas sp. TaxID=1962908 RepID=UPI00391D6DD0